MSAINQMLRDLDKRGVNRSAAMAPDGSAPAEATASTAPTAQARAYATVRMLGPRMRLSRNVLLAGGVVALLPIAWATTYFERPGAEPAAAMAATPAVVVAVSAPAPDFPSGPAASTEATAAALPRPAAASPATVEASSAAWGTSSTSGTSGTSGPVESASASAPAQAAVLSPQPAPTRSPLALPQPPRPRVVRAAVLPQLGEPDEPARNGASTVMADPVPRSATQPPVKAPKETRLALASPSVPKDEARIDRRPTDARDDLTRAGEAMSIGRTSDAIVLLRKVIQAEPENERARLALLSLLAERGRDDTWRSLLADSARAMPTRFGLAAAQGMAESGRFEQSLAILQALPEAVRDTRYFSALGATHQQLNQHAEAVTAFDAALNLAPGNSAQLPSLLVAQAMAMQSVGKQAEARLNLERVRQMPEAAAEMRDFASRELAHSR